MSNHNERRDSDDRRQEESGPPRGWKDRRRRTERRMPEINEHVVSEAEWLAYFGAGREVASPANSPIIASESSADIFDRVRD